MQTLIINAHPDPQNKTAYCINRLVDCLTKKLPDATVLNLYNEDIPELTAETLPVFNGAYSGDGKDAELSKGAQHFLARNAELLEQFKAANANVKFAAKFTRKYRASNQNRHLHILRDRKSVV